MADLMVDVIVVNDDGGQLAIDAFRFQHPTASGDLTAGSDFDPLICDTVGGDECYSREIPVGPGELSISVARSEYTITIECRVEDQPVQATADTQPTEVDESALVAASAASTATGASWDADPFAAIFCLITADDIADDTTTTEPPATDPPATTIPDPAPTTVAPTTVAPTTVAPTVPAPEVPVTTVPEPTPVAALPETGPSNTGWITLAGLACVALGAGTIRFARR